MGVRPPANDLDDGPDTVEFGIAELDARIEERNVPFPIESSDLRAAHGNVRVAVDPGGTEITLAEALEECDQRSFDSKQDLLNALHPVFEAKREKLSGGLLGWVRSVFPF